MVRDLIIESVEQRFGAIARLPHAVEWLHDNGSCYTARETTSFARDMGFISAVLPTEALSLTAWLRPSSKPSRTIVFMSTIGPAETVMAQLGQ